MGPGGPGEAVPAVRVALQDSAALIAGIEAVEHGDLGWAEGIAGRFTALAVASLDELQDDDRSLGGDGGELDQHIGAGELTVLEAQAVGLHQTEQLLDGPAPPVPVDDLPGGGGVADLMGGEKAPVYRFDTG